MTSQTIGRYQILNEIGRGGMAVVYRAADPQAAREVALKVLPRELLHDQEFRARFRREGEALAGLEHPAIVPVYDIGEHEGQPFLVMRLMTGGSLAARITPGGLPLAEVARVIGQLAAALDAAHGAGLIHRDVKPDNVLFDGEGRPYLADFGIVSLSESTSRLTRSGVIGTPDYMAPELTRPGGLTPLVDVYALGVLLYQMLSGRLPYSADTPIGTLVAHVTESIPDLRALRPELPPAVQQVLARALAKAPAERYQSAGALAADLAAVAGESLATIRVGQEEVSAVIAARRPPRRRGQAGGTFWGAVAAAVALALLVVGGSLAMSNRGGEPAFVAATSAPTATAVTIRQLPPPELAGDLRRLPFQVTDAAYSRALDRIVVAAGDQSALIILNPESLGTITVPLEWPPTALALSADGTRAAVGHRRKISYVDLTQGRVLKTLDVLIDVGAIAVDSRRVYVGTSEQNMNVDYLRAVSIETNIEENVGGISAANRLSFDPSGSSLYSVEWSSMPSMLARIDVSADPPARMYQSDDTVEHDACDYLWFSADGRRIFTGCGNIFQVNGDPDTDLAYEAQLNRSTQLRYVHHSLVSDRVAAIPFDQPDPFNKETPKDNEIFFYQYSTLRPETIVQLPDFPLDGKVYGSVGKYVFSDNSGANFYVLVRAGFERDKEPDMLHYRHQEDELFPQAYGVFTLRSASVR